MLDGQDLARNEAWIANTIPVRIAADGGVVRRRETHECTHYMTNRER